METIDLEKLKYPIGKFIIPTEINSVLKNKWISEIEILPSKLKSETISLNENQLERPYREGGWTVRQVVHHLADSHSNALIRIKFALTEDVPTIKPYPEHLWAELADSKTLDIKSSLQLIEALHHRWIVLLNSLSDTQFARTYFHPENKIHYSIEAATALYAWHSNHHLSHITSLKKRMNWK